LAKVLGVSFIDSCVTIADIAVRWLRGHSRGGVVKVCLRLIWMRK
jgi:hypothetical protein